MSADSAGVPWAGRNFEPNLNSDDDGSPPPRLFEAIRRFRAHEVGEAEVVAAVQESRLLVPLMAVLGSSAVGGHGLSVDKSQELSIVQVSGPDGRRVQPAFTSVAALSRWNADARPVPVAAPRVALAAAAEGTDTVVLDPISDTEFAIRRPALGAIARAQPWQPCYLDPEVLTEFMTAAVPEPHVRSLGLAPGDADARLLGPELLVHLSLDDGLDRASLDALIARLRERWVANELIAERVDSLAVHLTREV